MRGIEYRLSIPKYLFAQFYHRFSALPPIFPNLYYRTDLPAIRLNGKNWVRLKTLMSGICGSDQNMLKGQESYSLEPFGSFPCILGHENVAEVVEVGTSVTKVKVGDRVVVNPVMGCRVHDRIELCEYCAQGLDALCLYFGEDDHLGPGTSLGYHRATGGGWAEEFQAHEWQLHIIDKDIPLRRAVLTDPFTSAMQPVASVAEGKNEKKTVFVFGVGTIGLLTIASIRALNLPWKVVAGYRYEYQKNKAIELGADAAIHTGKNLDQRLASFFNSKIRSVSLGKPVFEGGFDVIFDCVGTPSTLNDSIRYTKNGGLVMMVATSNNLNGVDPTFIWFREVRLHGTCMSRSVIDPRDGQKKETYAIVKQILRDLHVESLVSHSFSIEDYKTALRTAMNKESPVIKVVFEF